jgi:NitT/TauT family transport system permease protein
MVFFVVFMNTISGVNSTNPHFINISRILGANYWQLMMKVIVPSAMPYILTALRIVVPTAMIGAIVGEFISSQRGLGFFISRATFMFDTASAFAGILMLLVVILVMNETVNRLESRLMRWQRDGRSTLGGDQGR